MAEPANGMWGYCHNCKVFVAMRYRVVETAPRLANIILAYCPICGSKPIPT